MKTIDKTKTVVLSIGVLTAMVSLIGAIASLNLIGYVFPLYVGLTLVGVSLLHKEQTTHSKTNMEVLG